MVINIKYFNNLAFWLCVVFIKMKNKGCSDCSHYHIHSISCVRGTCNPHYNFNCETNTHGKHIIKLRKEFEELKK